MIFRGSLRSLVLARACSLAVVTTLFIPVAGGALATDLPPSLSTTAMTPPSVTTVDNFYVDLASGDIQYSKPLVSIGSASAKALSATFFNVPADDENVGAIDYSGDAFMGVMSYKVSVGMETEIFTASGGNFISTQDPASSLVFNSSTNIYTYTKRDGTVATFSKGMANQVPRPSNQGVLTSVTYPNGEKTTYVYKNVGTTSAPIWVFKSVVSNRGLMLKYTGSVGVAPGLRITAVNLAQDYCDSLADSCAGLVQDAPQATVSPPVTSTSTSGDNTYYSITRSFINPLGKTSKRVTNMTYTNYGSIGPDGSGNIQTKIQSTSTLFDEINNTETVAYNDLWTGALTSDFSEGKVGSVSFGTEVSRAYIYAPGAGPTHPWMGTARGVSPGTNGDDRTVNFHLSSSVVYQVSPISSQKLGNTTSYQRDSYNRITQVTRPEGDIDVYAYDARGNVIQVTRKAKPSSALSDIIFSATFPASCLNPLTCNKPTATFDGKNNETDYTYDANSGQVLTVTMPADDSGIRPQTRYHYTAKYAQVKNSAGLSVNADSPIYVLDSVSQCRSTSSCSGGIDETVTTYQYSDNLYPTIVTTTSGDGFSTSTTTTYDALGDVTSVDGPLAGTVDTAYTTYDLLRRPIFEIGIDPDGASALLRKITHHVYDDAGNEIRTEAGIGQATDGSDFVRKSYVERTFNSSGLKSKEATFISGNSAATTVTQYSYDSSGRQVCSAVRMNPATFTSLPSDPCSPATTIGSDGPDRITQNVYDTASQVKAVYQGVGTSDVRRYAYYYYSTNGMKTAELDANYNMTTYGYDGFDRLSIVYYPSTTLSSASSSTTDYESIGYDANSNEINRRRRDGQYIKTCYDKLNRVNISFKHSQSGCPATGSSSDVYTTYDLQGHVKTKSFVSVASTGISYIYDGLGRLTSATDTNGRTVAYNYDAASNRLRLFYPDSANYVYYSRDYLGRVKGTNFGGVSEYLYQQTFNDLGQRISLTRGNGAVGGTTTFTSDNLGRLTGESVNIDGAGTAHDIAWTFTYNAANQISGWAASSVAYDNIVAGTATTNKTYDGLNRDAAIAAVSGGYDARGNVTNDGSRVMSYDVENRLLTVAATATPTSPYLVLAYDPEGRLATSTSTAGTTEFLYDGTNLIAEYLHGSASPTVHSADTMTARYVHGEGVDEPLIWYPGPAVSGPRYLIANYQGSIVAYTTASGAFSESYTYDPYGVPSYWFGSRFHYTGQIALPEAFLYYYKARAYDPASGRFLQIDPVGSKDDLDLYAYVAGDPVNKADPSGLVGGGGLRAAEGEALAISEARAMAIAEARAAGMSEEAAAVAGENAANKAYRSDDPFGQGAAIDKLAGDAEGFVKSVGDFFRDRGWTSKDTDKGGGKQYTDPQNRFNNVRAMPGKPDSPNPRQQEPYAKIQKGGNFVDENGKPIPNSANGGRPGDLPEAHVPAPKVFCILGMCFGG